MDNQANLLKQLNRLKAFKRIASTDDGMVLIDFILKASKLNEDPHESGKNSGQTQHALGKQSVGRALLDSLIQAGVQVNGNIFSKKSGNKIEELETDLNNLMQGE
jgi:hypothetical protein